MVTWGVFSLATRAVRLGNRRCIQCNVSIRSRQQLRGCVERQVSSLRLFKSSQSGSYSLQFHSIQFHSIPCHSVPFGSIQFHSIAYIPLRPLHAITFQFDPLHSIALSRCIAFNSIPFHSTTFHSTTFHCIPFLYVPLHSTMLCTFHGIPVHSISFHYILLRSAAFSTFH